MGARPAQWGVRGARAVRATLWAWALGGLAVGSGCAGPGAAAQIGAEVARTAADHGARGAIAVHLPQAEAALAAGRPDLAGARLAALWPATRALADDRAVREVVRRLPPGAAPPSLAAVVAVEAAQGALEAGRPQVARALLVRGGLRRGDASRTGLRGAVTAALAELDGDVAVARARLGAVANGRYADPVAAELGALARLTLGGSFLDEGAFKEAIASLLRVEGTSGYWRAARLGLATCQLRAGRPEAALKILALLPGGLAAEPERALLAAMAAHALGLVDEAIAIVDAALAWREAWRATAESAPAVFVEATRLERGGDAPPEDTLVTVVAAAPAVRAATAELAATRAEIGRAAGCERSSETAGSRRRRQESGPLGRVA